MSRPVFPWSSSDRLLVVGSAAFLLAVLSLAALSVLAAPTGTPTVDANVTAEYRAIDTVSATREVVIKRNGTVASRTVAEATVVPGTEKRRVSVTSETKQRYDLRVSNGSTLWLHDEDRNHFQRIPLRDWTSEPGDWERVRQLLARANLTTGSTDGDRPGVAPLPVVPQRRPPTRAAPPGPYTVEYQRTAIVGDRETYVLVVTPARDRHGANYRQTVWIDTERFYPLKRQTVWTHDGTRTVVTRTATNVSFVAEPPATTFEPTIPKDANVTRASTPTTERFADIDRLRAVANARVPTPSVPPSYRLAYATRTTGQLKGVGLRFINRSGTLTVAKYDFAYPADGGDRTVAVDGRQAALTRGLTTTLSWSCGDHRYTVRGRGIPEETLVDTARSVGCPAG